MTSIHEYLDRIKSIEESILQYLDEDNLEDQNFSNLMETFNKYKIGESKYELKLFLKLISKISISHHRSEGFFGKIEKILKKIQDRITFFFSNTEITTIFRQSKRILLFLLEENIIIYDNFFKKITKSKRKRKLYDEYFSPDIDQSNEDELNDFKTNQKIGENEKYICSLIRKDSIEEFVSYVTRTNLSLSVKVPPSIFETNHFLYESKIIDCSLSLIEYAAFFGSLQIFQYLLFNNVELTEELWNYAIHGNNPEIIHLLEGNEIKPDYSMHLSSNCINSIYFHHNDITNYLLINYMKGKNIDYLHFMTKSYNFIALSDTISNILDYDLLDFEKIDEICLSLIIDLSKYGYYHLIDLLLKDNKFEKYKTISLFLAIGKNKFDFTQLLLLNYCIDVNNLYFNQQILETPLILAVKNNNAKITKLLLSYDNININYIPEKLVKNERFIDGEPALHIAIKNGNFKIVKLYYHIKTLMLIVHQN